MSDDKYFTLKKESKSDVYHINLGKTIESDTSQYQEILDVLREADEEDEVNIYLDCDGGDTNTSGALANAISESKATVNAIVTGRSYSAACDIALSADTLTLNRFTFLMFHNYSTGIEGKGNELMTRIRNEHKVEEQMIHTLYSPFLTKLEIRDILSDKDVYVHWDDKDLKDRIARHFGEGELDEDR